jgi:hypothetical protein
MQVVVFLRRRAEIQDRTAAHRVVHAHHRGARRTARGNFFERERIRHVVGVRTAPFRGHHHAEQTQLAHLLHHFVGQDAVAIPLRGVRRKPFCGEFARRVANHALLVGMEIVHRLAPVSSMLRRCA